MPWCRTSVIFGGFGTDPWGINWFSSSYKTDRAEPFWSGRKASEPQRNLKGKLSITVSNRAGISTSVMAVRSVSPGVQE